MKILLTVVACLALVATITPACLYLAGMIDPNTTKWIMLGGTIAWFGSAPFVLGTTSGEQLAEDTGEVIVP